MVNELKRLMRENVEAPPPDHLDLDAVMVAGRRRGRTRRLAVAAAALAVVAVATTSTLVATQGAGPSREERTDAAAEGPMPTPDAPTITLSDAVPAVEGRDYEVLTSYTNDNLNRTNGQYLDGVTDDGLVLFRDGPRSDQRFPRYSLLDPATGERDELPRLGIGQHQVWPVELSAERLVLVGAGRDPGGNGLELPTVAHVLDRGAQQWRTVEWSGLPPVEFPTGRMGPDGRLYVPVPASRGAVPEGGWPLGEGGEADDSDAEGDTYRLWSVSLDDPTDVRDEDLTVGDVAFTDEAMVWTDSTNGDAGRVHVRDLATGEETDFDPRTGERCNLLGFGASGDRIMMSQYCGDYESGRDDRVQVLSTSGEQIATLQQSGVEGYLAPASEVVTITAYPSVRRDRTTGAYAYDLATDRLLRLSDGVSSFGLGGPTAGPRELMWHVPANGDRGATQYVGRLLR